jgi:hypothetical protein
MTKRDLFLLSVAPVILTAAALDLLWLADRMHQGSERRLSNYAVLQKRAAEPDGTENASRSSERAALILSRIAAEAHESDAATATVSTRLALLLLVVSAFQAVLVARLLRSEQQPASSSRSDNAKSAMPALRSPPGATAAPRTLSDAVNHTFL